MAGFEPPRPPAAPPTTPGVLGAVTRLPRPPGELTSDERTMAMLVHLLAIFTGFIGPLVIWLIKKNESRFVDAHGRECLNWVFTVLLANVVLWIVLMVGVLATIPAGGGRGPGAAFVLTFCGFYLLVIGIAIADVILKIVGCVSAYRGRFRGYPVTIPFFRRGEPFGPI